MSLFGDDYEGPSASAARSALFGDVVPSRAARTAAVASARSTFSTVAKTVATASDSLFGGDDGEADPWSLPTPRMSQKPTIATLLSPANCPQAYRDSFSAEGPINGALTTENVRHAIDRAGLSNSSSAAKIMDVVVRSKPDNRIDLGTWCAVMAMIGLAQAGEDDINLDAVDSRRNSLPQTRLRQDARPAPVQAPAARAPSIRAPSIRNVPASRKNVAVPVPVASRQAYAPSTRGGYPQQQQVDSQPPLFSQRQLPTQPLSIPPTSSFSNDIPPTSMTPPSPSSPPGISVADPWAAEDDDDEDAISPSPYASTTSYGGGSAYSSTNYTSSSAYSSTNYSSPNNVPGMYQPQTINTKGVSDNYNSNYSSVLGADYNDLARSNNDINSSLFTDEPIIVPQSAPNATVVEDDDSDVGEEDGEPRDPSYVPNFPYTRAQPYYDAHEGDRIRVTIIPEKEGVFMFRHVNYLLEGASVPGADGTLGRGGNRVVRRYSDFVWLLNCLLKRYPFRILPLLPPKRFAVNGHYLSSDEFFLERRRRGLSRFINELIKHPVLSREQLVVMFLSVPTELTVWRKQASVSVEDEFTGRALPAGLVESWSVAEAERWEDVQQGVKMEAELYTHLCLLIDRMEKRQESVAADHQRFANSLQTLQEVTQKTYSVDSSDLSLINDGVKNVAKYLTNAQTLLEDESRGWEIGVLEDFKRHRDGLISIKELFERMEKLDINQIPLLERRISNNETRLSGMRNRSDFKSGDIERVEHAIQRDRETIKEQHTRSWLIKECMRDELAYFQQTKYRVAKLFQDYAQERLKYAELFAENWRVLSNEISEVPTQQS
ncbi:uncharacterized protein V1518DRAFT_413771 [Limtongia smithiae]|uniref:uncharacterized protein n=1 Tax=Limtongia smithiae TaxID=1125753 RepID=UPI0034CDA6B1